MSKIFCIAIAGSLLFTACKKSTTTTPTTTTTTTTTTTSTPTPTDGWMLGTTKYKQAYCLRQTNQFALNCVDATSGTINSFAAFFSAYPTVSGTYHIVAFKVDSTTTYPGKSIGANDVIITGSIPKTTGSGDNTYWSAGLEGKDAIVTLTAGKIKIEVPQVSVVSAADTLKITGTMIEN
ncbi:MAG: hypothetical protein JWQ38_1860 [Flavipsychrobacter sp.]|nr:hypothetical protein [Flavipsychrobacter sp.]